VSFTVRSDISASGALIIQFCPPVTGPLQSHGGLADPMAWAVGVSCQAVCRRDALNRPREVLDCAGWKSASESAFGLGLNEMTVMSLQLARGRAGRLPWFDF
jgi:hypothetical protein